MNFFLRTGLNPYSRVFLVFIVFSLRLYHFLIVVCCMPKCLRVRLTEFFLSRLCFFSLGFLFPIWDLCISLSCISLTACRSCLCFFLRQGLFFNRLS